MRLKLSQFRDFSQFKGSSMNVILIPKEKKASKIEKFVSTRDPSKLMVEALGYHIYDPNISNEGLWNEVKTQSNGATTMIICEVLLYKESTKKSLPAKPICLWPKYLISKEK